MRTPHLASRPLPLALLACPLLLVGCSSQDHALGTEGGADAGDARAGDLHAITCEQDGKTYQVGETITLSACATCVCQPDGTVGMCTGDCPPDAASDAAVKADAAVKTDAPTPTDAAVKTDVPTPTDTAVKTDAPTPTDTAGDAPVKADAATRSDADAAVTCIYNGTTYQAGDIIPTSACASCVCQADGTVGMCTGDCPPDAATDGDAAVTCTQDGKTYQVGERVGSGCVSCACQPDGTWGMCTGACPPDGAIATDTDNSPAAMCTRTQGAIVTSQCCLSAGDFPSTCAPGPCGCAPSDSHAISTCSCPAGTCFDATRGCIGVPGVCTPGQDQTCNADPIVSSIHGYCQDDGSCLCIAGNSRAASGKCN